MNSMYAVCLVMILCISQCQMQRTEPGTCKRKFTDCKNIEEQVAPEAPEKLSDINKDSSATKCFSSVLEQINLEFTASLVYLQMGAHFSRDVVNLPGFAKFFLDSASEEREHGIKLINYLLMRGDTLQENDLKDPQDKALIVFPSIEKTQWSSGLDALHDALTLERKVTESIKLLIKACDNDRTIELLKNNRVTGYIQDYHITDWLTAEYLEEQYKGQRELAGKIFTLSKLIEKDSHKNLGEFIFDKKLLGVNL